MIDLNIPVMAVLLLPLLLLLLLLLAKEGLAPTTATSRVVIKLCTYYDIKDACIVRTNAKHDEGHRSIPRAAAVLHHNICDLLLYSIIISDWLHSYLYTYLPSSEEDHAIGPLN